MPKTASQPQGRGGFWWTVCMLCLALAGCQSQPEGSLNTSASSLFVPLSRSPVSSPPPLHPGLEPALHRQVRGAEIEAAAADPQTFHLTLDARPATGPFTASPFVVKRGAWAGAKRGQARRGQWLSIPGGRLWITPGGTILIADAQHQPLLWANPPTSAAGVMHLTLHHAPGLRLYGGGNAARGQAGPLIQTAGVSVVANGVTRIPFLWSPAGWGILIANDEASVSWTEARTTLRWSVPGRGIDLYVMLAARTPQALLGAYARLTGRAPLPPRWTFGYLQSRWGYQDAADVQDKWRQFQARHIPVDAFLYDYDWFINDWQFNPKTFPHPKAELAAMHAQGLHFVGIRKPRVHGVHWDKARRRGWLLVGADLRFDLPAVRAWWWGKQRPLAQDGVDGWWNDEAEQADDEFFGMAEAEWDGGRAASPRRVWSLNRAFSPGMARFGAAAWTGDIDSRWQALANQPGTLLNWSLAGMPFVGQDIGGFSGLPTPELYARWMEEGVFVPIMRAHGTFDSPRWPWAFGSPAFAAARKAIQLRYRLIPYLYTCAEQTARQGMPLMRPLFFAFPQDTRTYGMEDEWLLGPSLLAAPLLTPGDTRTVYLPPGRWYVFSTGQALVGGRTVRVHAALDQIPAYVRAGTILPLGPVIPNTSHAEDPLEIRVYPGRAAAFDLYEDAGDDYGYLRGKFSRLPLRWENRTRTLVIGPRVGHYPGMLLTRHLRVVLPDGETQSVFFHGPRVVVHFPRIGSA